MNEEKKKINFFTIFKILLLLGVLVFMYARFIGTRFINIKEYAVYDTNLPDSLNGLKIIHLSDIHYGTIINKKNLTNIVNKINLLNPDIVIFTGDLYDESIVLNEKTTKEIIDCLKNIKSKLGKFAVTGNHDYSNNSFSYIMNQSGFTYLQNTSKLIYDENNTALEIIGFDDAWKGNPNYNLTLSDNYKIVLVHEPDEIDNILPLNVNLVFAGHSHGGQIRLPIIGALYTPSGAKKYKNDYYEFDNTKMYISYGVGTSILKIRLFNQPSINFYRLYKS